MVERMCGTDRSLCQLCWCLLNVNCKRVLRERKGKRRREREIWQGKLYVNARNYTFLCSRRKSFYTQVQVGSHRCRLPTERERETERKRERDREGSV